MSQKLIIVGLFTFVFALFVFLFISVDISGLFSLSTNYTKNLVHIDNNYLNVKVNIIPDWCWNYDGNNFFVQGTIFSNKYPGGIKDYCKFINGKNYLLKGTCINNKYAYIQKNCKELGATYSCINGECTDIPKNYFGDGNYLIGQGDTIISDNNITIKVLDVKEFKDNKKIVEILSLLPFAGDDQLDVYPLTILTSTKYPVKLYPVELSSKSDSNNYNGKIILNVRSLDSEKYNSCTEVYTSCLKNHDEEECTGFCAINPISDLNEQIITEGNYNLIYQTKFQKEANYFMSQLKACIPKIKNIMGITEPWNTSEKYVVHVQERTSNSFISAITSKTGITMYVNDPDMVYNKDPSENCIDPTFVHELSHYMRGCTEKYSPIWTEGAAVYVQQTSGIYSSSDINPFSYQRPIICGEKGFKYFDQNDVLEKINCEKRALDSSGYKTNFDLSNIASCPTMYTDNGYKIGTCGGWDINNKKIFFIFPTQGLSYGQEGELFQKVQLDCMKFFNGGNPITGYCHLLADHNIDSNAIYSDGNVTFYWYASNENNKINFFAEPQTQAKQIKDIIDGMCNLDVNGYKPYPSIAQMENSKIGFEFYYIPTYCFLKLLDDNSPGFMKELEQKRIYTTNANAFIPFGLNSFLYDGNELSKIYIFANYSKIKQLTPKLEELKNIFDLGQYTLSSLSSYGPALGCWPLFWTWNNN